MDAALPPQPRMQNNYFDGLNVTGRHKAIFFIIMMAYFLEQMDNWNFGFIAPAVFKSWGYSQGESTKAMAHIFFWYFLGMTSGGFFGGLISDLIGRRPTFLFAIILFSLGSVVNGLPIDNFTLFVAARALTGFGVFCLMVCSQAYIAEMAPAESRGKWQGLVAAIGFCAVPVIAFLCRIIVPLGPEAWRLIFYFGGLGMLGFFIAYRYLPESPRWLVSRNNKAAAEAVMKNITRLNIDLSEAMQNVVQRGTLTQVLAGMFTPRYIRRTLLLLLIFITVTPAGFTFTSWTGKLLASIPVIDPGTGLALFDAYGEQCMLYDQATMLTIMTIISCGVPAGCWLASIIADKGGRKIPICAMYVLAAVMCLLFAKFSTHFFIVALCGFMLSVFNMAGGFILFSYTAESYPTPIRNASVGMHNAMARFSVSGFQYAIPLILASFGGTVGLINYDIPAIFTTCSILFVVPVPFILLFGQRTGGKSLEDIS